MAFMFDVSEQEIEKVLFRVGNRLGVSLEVHDGNRRAFRNGLMRKPVHVREAKYEVLTTNVLGERLGGVARRRGIGHFDGHTTRTRRFGSSVYGERGIGA